KKSQLKIKREEQRKRKPQRKSQTEQSKNQKSCRGRNGSWRAKSSWPAKSNSLASAMPSRRSAANYPGSRSKRTTFSIPPAARKRSPISSTAKANSSSITLCSVRSGKKPARAAPSTWTIRTQPLCTWHNATSPSRQFPARPFPRSKPSRSAWDGSSTGSRPTEATSTCMGWKFNWVSSYGSDFNYDYHVSFRPEQLAKGKVEFNFELMEFPSEEAPGISVFYKDEEGNIFHTYSAYARGTETTMNTYNYLDYVPKGRDEDGLAFTMSWLRHHDRYDTGKLADANLPYWPADAVRQDHGTAPGASRNGSDEARQ